MNWTALTKTDLYDLGHNAIVDAAEAQTAGSTTRVIADVVAKIRASISSGNQLDQDTTKIPNSLKEIALRLVIRKLKGKVNFPLTKDEQEDRKEDDDYLDRISRTKARFEKPDVAAGSAEMQSGASMRETAQEGDTGNSREDLQNL